MTYGMLLEEVVGVNADVLLCDRNALCGLLK